MPNRQNLGLGSWPRRRATLSPNRIAIDFEGQVQTFAQFAQRVEALSAWLSAQGVDSGDRVAYWGNNHVALLESIFAAARIGAIAVLLNARLAPAEAEFILNDSEPKVLLYGQEQAGAINIISERIYPDTLVDIDGADPSVVYYGDLELDHDPVNEVNSSLDDPAVLMYTSGTTGRPKGAVLTHGNLFFNDVNALIETDLRPDEVCLAAAPLFHIAGLNGLVLPAFLKGGTIVIQRGVNADDIFDAIDSKGISSFFAVPAMLDSLAHHPRFPDADLSSLRTIIVGGAPVPERSLRSWTERGVAVQQGYGLTETAPAVLKLSAEDGIPKAGAAGKPQFLVDVRLVAPSGDPARTNDIGEIQTVGPNVIHEYWRNPNATDAAFSDGWFRTGDAAVQDDDGYFWIRDRYKDMFVSGGENVYPAEIESALLDIPGVAEAAVIGVPDDRWGEVGKAFVVVDSINALTDTNIREALTTRLSRFKIPKQVEFLPEMPRTSTGKLLKTDLRNR